METKKSAIDLTDLAVGIVVLGVVVAIGVTVLANMQTARRTDLDIITTNHETITALNATGSKLSNTWVSGVNNMTNITDGTLIDAANYTVSIDSITGQATITLSPGALPAELNESTFNVSYNWYNTSRADYSLLTNSITGIAEYGSWFSIIVIVGVAAVVLGLIFMAFGKSGSGGTAY
jgi:hypothetical protein